MTENTEKSETITIRKDHLWKYSTFALLGILIVGAILFALPNKSPTGNVIADNGAALPQVKSQVSIDDDAILGDPNAKVTIVEFSDYQCPFCRKFWTETLPPIRSEYIDTGKVNLVYRDFPLTSIHPAAMVAAQATECVREQGGDEAYYEMHDKIFEESNILDGGDALTGPVRGTAQFGATELKQWAKELGYDISSCLDSGKYANEVQADLADGSSVGIQGTPGFFIGNDKEGYTLVSGAQPYSAFKQVIDAALA